MTAGAKLTIINTSGAPVTIHRVNGSELAIFRNLGELHLGDNNSERIILDGGSTFDWDDSEHKLMPESSKAKEVQTYPLIVQKGLMYMNNVTITNFCGLAFNPVLLFQTRNKTFIDNCLFEKCFGAQVACILVNPADPEPDPKDCAISISNTTFRHCEGGTEYNDDRGRGYNYSGIIRNIGLATSNILLSNVVIEDNYLAGGGIVCNLSRKGKLTVDGCSIRRNRVGSYGAGIWSEGAFEAIGAPTIIENNYAAKGGSGFTITTYGGEYKFTANRTYNFNDKLIIRNNKTAGIGGGVFVANNASLSFNVTDNLFGLYGNTATNGADDIFANGNGTSIALPDVSAMNLTGYSINLPPNSLYWVEDYIPDDANYSAGTQKMGANYPGSLSFKNWRYRYALEHDDYTFYTVDGNQTLTCYTALALGYQIVYITVTKSGMKAGDTAMFCIRSQGAADDYLTFMLSDRDKVVAADGSVTWQKRVRLFSGTWTVAEVDAWTWAYNPTSDTSYTRTVNSASSAADLTFAFTNASKADAPPHAEDSIVNDLDL